MKPFMAALALAAMLVTWSCDGGKAPDAHEIIVEEPEPRRDITNIERQILNDTYPLTADGQLYHTYEGQLYHGRDIWNVKMAFAEQDGLITHAILYDSRFGKTCHFACDYRGGEILLTDPEAYGNLSITLHEAPDQRLVGKLNNGHETLTFRIMPYNKPVDVDAPPATGNLYANL